MISKELLAYRWLSISSLFIWIGLFFHIMYFKFNFLRLCKDKFLRNLFRNSMYICYFIVGILVLIFPICVYLKAI